MNENSRISPVDSLLRTEALPSCWCSGCGIGTVVNAFTQAVKESDVPLDEVRVLSTGIGCTGKVTDYLKMPSEAVTNGSIVKQALKLSDEEPSKKTVIFLDDADFIVSGSDLFNRAGEKDTNLLVVYFNNYIYRIFVEHRKLMDWSPSGPSPEKPLKSPFNMLLIKKFYNYVCRIFVEHKSLQKFFYREALQERPVESPFNIPQLARSHDASYIARWTSHHPRRLMDSMVIGLKQPRLSFIEVISPCLMYFTNVGQKGSTLNKKEMFQDNLIIRNNESTENLDLRSHEKIIVGEFRNSEHRDDKDQ